VKGVVLKNNGEAIRTTFFSDLITRLGELILIKGGMSEGNSNGILIVKKHTNMRQITLSRQESAYCGNQILRMFFKLVQAQLVLSIMMFQQKDMEEGND
jgi:hypothetical protein